jgi:hypothetical protein
MRISGTSVQVVISFDRSSSDAIVAALPALQ